LLLAGGAFYSALVVATQIDHIFFPDSQLNLGGLSRLPGIDRGQDGTDLTGGRINVLVMGLDRRPNQGSSAARTDTMFVLTIDPSSRTARGLAMPRDLWVEIPGYYYDRINTAYVLGETQRHPGGGPALARETVEKLLGIKIHHYVAIDFEGFKQIIDLLGGIEIEVDTPVYDPTYSDTELPGDYYPCIFDVGTHHMNGKDALCYARTRRNSSDFERIQRQQRVIFAVIDKASQLRVLSDPSNVVNLWKRYKSTVQTDISDFQIPGYARLASGMGSDRLAFLTLAAAVTPWTTPAGASVLLPSEAGIKMMVESLFADYRIQEENASIEVQNATNTEGYATRAAQYLTGLGIAKDHLTATNAAATQNRTEIIDFVGKRYTAERIAGWLGLSKDRVRAATAADSTLRTTNADILVILGTDAKIESTTLSAPSGTTN
jgi:LCP family protein required for cell wall assembly